MHAAQGTAYFEVAEIWLLKQMLLLVLFERFAEGTGETVLGRWHRGCQRQSARKARAVELTRLIESIRKFSDSDFKARFLRSAD